MSAIYKFSDDSLQLTSNAFPVRSRNFPGRDGAWIVGFKEEAKRTFEAIVSTQRFNEVESEEQQRKSQFKKRHILKHLDRDVQSVDIDAEPRVLDGFYLMHLCCIEDPSDVVTINICKRNLQHVREEDMMMFDCVIEINANENNLTLDSFKTFPRLKILHLACNNIKTLYLKHDEFNDLENLDLSFNNLNSHDIAHLGILKNLKVLKLSGNDIDYLPDSFSNSYVITNENNEKVVMEKFPKLEELYLDNNQLKEDNCFDVLSTLRKLKKLYLNNNNIMAVPYLKIYDQNHVVQQFGKSYYKRKIELNKFNEKVANEKKSAKEFLTNDPQNLNTFNASFVGNLKPSHEIDTHKSNFLRNSFILEEEEEQQEGVNQSQSLKTDMKMPTLSGMEESSKQMSLPFAELVYINLSDNKIEEDDDLIAIASWPLLHEVVLFNNPIVLRNVGFTPLVKKFLIDRLGIAIQRIKPLNPLKAPHCPPKNQKSKNRIVKTYIPKVTKMPVEMRMLCYQNQNEVAKTNIPEVESENKTEKNNKSDNVNYQQFFMTEGDDLNLESEEKEGQIDRDVPELEKNMNDEEKKNAYDILFDIENEDKIKVPKDIGSCVRALRNILDHPLVYRDACYELDKPQAIYNPKKKYKKKAREPRVKSGIEKVKTALEKLRERKYYEETELKEALSNTYEKKLARKLLKQVQNKYNAVRYESLSMARSPNLDLEEIQRTLGSMHMNQN